MKPLALILAMASIPAIPKADMTARERVIAVAESQIGVREATGRNDGEVNKYLAAVGMSMSQAPYCAAFNFWVGSMALDPNPFPRSAWSPDHLRGGTRVTESTVVRGGEAFGIYFPSKNRIAHTGLLRARDGVNFVTLEANTSADVKPGSSRDRDGNGVFSKRRHWRTVHSVRDWIGGAK